MCTAATYKTKDFYFGRTLDYEFSYGERITVTPRNYPFEFRHAGTVKTHSAIIAIMVLDKFIDVLSYSCSVMGIYISVAVVPDTITLINFTLVGFSTWALNVSIIFEYF